jgi:energy-coupling factor transporter ATP-binding protein EcfA2
LISISTSFRAARKDQLAAAVAGAYPLIMLDEPTIGQDDDTCRELFVRSKRLQRRYGVVFVTHDDAFASRVPHRVLRVENKQIG